jgi:SAM-dependent methyltransferase
VLGIDLSENMLLRAAINTPHANVSYRRAAIEDVDLPAGAYDLVFSSLALHYVESFDRVCDAVARLLAPGGAFVFSVEHPIYTASWSPRFEHDGEGRAYWPLNRYLDEGARVTDWLAPGVIKQHRTISSYVNGLIGTGFCLTLLQEWGPSAKQIEAHPEWAVERDRPMFLLVSAARM